MWGAKNWHININEGAKVPGRGLFFGFGCFLIIFFEFFDFFEFFFENVLKTKKMRAETGYMVVPEFLDLVQYMMGKHPNLWNKNFQSFIKNSLF